MKQIFLNGVAFVRKNPRILYSFVLLVFVPAAFFFNTYHIISGIEQDIDRITQRKAILVEALMNDMLIEKMHDTLALQQAVEAFAQKHDDIVSLAVLQHDEAQLGVFRVVASSERDDIDQTSENVQYVLAWNNNEGIAFLDEDEQGRFWRVTRLLYNTNGEKSGLVSASFSLRDSDALIDTTVNQSYIVLVVTVIVVLLLVSNQARLFGSVLAFNKLKEVDEMKDNLVSMASHELRTPLTAIRGYIDLLESKKATWDKDAIKYMTNISFSVEHLNDLVNDMLEVSRLEGNRIPMELVPLQPQAIIERSIEELRSQAMEKNLDLHTEDIADEALIGDEDRLREILVNLIGNALKYTAKGSVTVSSRVQDGWYAITVADTGFGISAEDQKKLFQKFSRIQTSETKAISGTGLGLWITFGLAEKMGGSITVESIEGVGSHFTVRLPVAKKS